MKVGGGIIPVTADVLFGVLGKGLRGRSWAALCIYNVRFSGVSVYTSYVLLKLCSNELHISYMQNCSVLHFILTEIKGMNKNWLVIWPLVESNCIAHTGLPLPTLFLLICWTLTVHLLNFNALLDVLNNIQLPFRVLLGHVLLHKTNKQPQQWMQCFEEQLTELDCICIDWMNSRFYPGNTCWKRH